MKLEMDIICSIVARKIKENKRNGIILDPEIKKGVLEAQRESERITHIKTQIENEKINITSVYAPQAGCEETEKDEFWDNLRKMTRRIPSTEVLWACGDRNGHVGNDNNGVEECMTSDRNTE